MPACAIGQNLALVNGPRDSRIDRSAGGLHLELQSLGVVTARNDLEPSDVVYNDIEYASGYVLDLNRTPHRVEFSARIRETVNIPHNSPPFGVEGFDARETEVGGYSLVSKESFALQALDCADEGVPRRLHAVIKAQPGDIVEASRTVELRRTS